MWPRASVLRSLTNSLPAARAFLVFLRARYAFARLNHAEPVASTRRGSATTRSHTVTAWSHWPRPEYAAHRPLSALTCAFGFLPSLRETNSNCSTALL